ncbi:hypothetical protein HWB26_gp23 [Lentibacter phage vB_LenP_ICBM2]|uniref:Uncharacterized protein n=1 Tax=Lentibacter phage vB_LenP_ICBM2 TaxID=2847823 RepID=A0A3G2YRP7_9CAUD|nr:hypothetical protein HWB26_gp23 [Lentibacter phage vB_LenP_ICBM2]AYP28084.1 hypothetical protein vBLenPICBM2__23 [Lentibacter phage vB_LenP_ICBM2]
MFDLESRIAALVENLGLAYVLEQIDLSEETVVRMLVDEGYLDLEDFFNTDAEMEYWKERDE